VRPTGAPSRWPHQRLAHRQIAVHGHAQPTHGHERDHELQHGDHRVGERGARGPEGGQTAAGQRSLPEDEQRGEGQVEQVGEHHAEHDRAGTCVRLQVAPARDEGEVGQHRREPRREVTARLARHVRRDAEALEARTEQEAETDERRREERAEPYALPEPATRDAGLARPSRLSDEGVDAQHRADTDHRRREEQRAAEARRRHGRLPEPAHHGEIHRPERDLTEVGERERRRQARQDAQLRAERSHHRGGGERCGGLRHARAATTDRPP
jgi:hypothetical protein